MKKSSLLVFISTCLNLTICLELPMIKIFFQLAGRMIEHYLCPKSEGISANTIASCNEDETDLFYFNVKVRIK